MLMILIMSCNYLEYLPQDIRNMKHLIFLDMSENVLLYLPAIMSQLNLYFVTVSENPFLNRNFYVNNLKMPKLIELSAKEIINQKFVASYSCTSVLLFVLYPSKYAIYKSK